MAAEELHDSSFFNFKDLDWDIIFKEIEDTCYTQQLLRFYLKVHENMFSATVRVLYFIRNKSLQVVF